MGRGSYYLGFGTPVSTYKLSQDIVSGKNLLLDVKAVPFVREGTIWCDTEVFRGISVAKEKQYLFHDTCSFFQVSLFLR